MNENEYAKKCIPVIGGLLTIFQENHVFVPEVPRDSHNDHADLLVILTKSKQMFLVEFKIGKIKEHIRQIKRTNNRTGIITIGLNAKGRGDFIFNFDIDSDIERFTKRITMGYSQINVTSWYQTTMSRLYWFGYQDQWCQSSFFPDDLKSVGAKNADRLSLYQIFQKACLQIFLEHGTIINFEVIYAAIGHGVYAESVARKHYKEARKIYEEKL